MQLYVTMMLTLPLMPHDLKKDEVPGIHDMLNKVMEEFAARRGICVPLKPAVLK